MTRTCVISDTDVAAIYAICGDTRLWTAAKLRQAGFNLQHEIQYDYDDAKCITTFTQIAVDTKEAIIG